MLIYRSWSRFQFPFRRDVLCNAGRFIPSAIENGVSIPFSSGCALQFPVSEGEEPIIYSFNSLFVGMCFAIQREIYAALLEEPFQFPFRRDVLCNSLSRRRHHSIVKVSIPFSSGCALQLKRAPKQYPLAMMFQFPFRRDVLCNWSHRPHGQYVSSGFNSLFVGMCFAMFSGLLSSFLYQMFQFPFRRDVLCNLRPGCL